MARQGACHSLVYQNNPHLISLFKTYQQKETGLVELGYYVSGQGSFDSGDPMVFSGGAGDCGSGRASEAYWYCWYDAYDQVVPLDFV